MKLEFALQACEVRAPGISSKADFMALCQSALAPDPAARLPRAQAIPMLSARRLHAGSRLAADLAVSLLRQHPDIAACVFVSRHGELQRNFSILQALATHTEVSPTDFTMSVHNAAGGIASIQAKKQLPVSSVAAGAESFMQGLTEASLFLQSGHRQVLLVAFEGQLPDFYTPLLPSSERSLPHAVAVLLQSGHDFTLSTAPAGTASAANAAAGAADVLAPWPALQFARFCLTGAPELKITAGRHSWSFEQESSQACAL